MNTDTFSNIKIYYFSEENLERTCYAEKKPIVNVMPIHAIFLSVKIDGMECLTHKILCKKLAGGDTYI